MSADFFKRVILIFLVIGIWISIMLYAECHSGHFSRDKFELALIIIWINFKLQIVIQYVNIKLNLELM